MTFDHTKPRCGSCKHYKVGDAMNERAHIGHYDEETDEWVSPPGYGLCARVQLNREPDGTEKAVVVDGSGYFAAIICTKDFGCVLHELEREIL